MYYVLQFKVNICGNFEMEKFYVFVLHIDRHRYIRTQHIVRETLYSVEASNLLIKCQTKIDSDSNVVK